MNSRTDHKKTVAEIVRADYRTADVFKKYGINYCCGGKVTLEEACATKEVDFKTFMSDLEKATKTVNLSNNIDYDSWKVDFLIDYIVNLHHAYLYRTLPVLQGSLLSFVNSHKKHHPEFEEIQEVFQRLSNLLIMHNRQEEEVIFPYIKQIANTYRRKESYGSLFVRTLRKPLSSIEAEHTQIEDLLEQLRALTHHYKFPSTACTNHQVIFCKLREFDDDIVHHKHLENNILFPKAINMEKELLQL